MKSVGKTTLLVVCLAMGINAAPSGYSGGVYTKETSTKGKWEARCKLAAGSGIVSAFYTWDVTGDYKDNVEDCNYYWWREIDVEVLGKNIDTIETVIHCVPCGEFDWVTHPERWGHHGFDFELDDDYHTYTIENHGDYVAWYLDGVEYRRENGDWTAPMDSANMGAYIQLWGGNEPGWCGPFNPAADGPFYMYISWYKHYEFTPGEGPEGSDYTLKWMDDFEGSELDTQKWGICDWPDPGYEYNGTYIESTTGHPDNVAIKDGKLILCTTDINTVGHSGTVPEDAGEHGIAAQKRSAQAQYPSVVGMEALGAMVTYNLVSAGWVSLTLHDVRGRRIRTLASAWQDAGAYRINLDEHAPASGTYLVRMAGPMGIQSVRVLR